MEKLELHSSGEEDHLKTLKEKYGKLKESLKNNRKLTAERKKVELEKIDREFRTEKMNARQNLY